MRLFLAIEIPEAIKTVVVERLQHGLPRVRWTPAEQLHLTLRFIGDATESEFESICAELEGVDFASFDLILTGLQKFIGARSSSVLWLGTNEPPELHELKRSIDRSLQRIGIPFEKRRFQPHITLARLKNAPDHRVDQYIREYNDFVSDAFSVSEFVLFSSVLSRNGARHTPEAIFSSGLATGPAVPRDGN